MSFPPTEWRLLQCNRALALCVCFMFAQAGCSQPAADNTALEQEVQQLREANQELQHLKSENQELGRLRRDNEEVKRLAAQTQDLPKLRQENDQLRGQLQLLKQPKPKLR
ncbi:MAG: hypothetical protein U1G07_11600 [Verrucomicrobiota bacterium]